MVTRVTTAGSYASMLANLKTAQAAQAAAGQKLSTQRNGQDLKDYANNAEFLTAARSLQSQVATYQDKSQALSAKLDAQDTSLSRVSGAAAQIRQLMTEALASGRADTLVSDIQGQMSTAVAGLNAQYDGKYLFAGGQVNTRPVTATSLSDLTAGGTTISDFFKNDDYAATSKVDDATTLTTGFRADDVGTGMMTALKAFQAFNEGPNGPFTGELTPAQQSFLESQLSSWSQIGQDLNLNVARNGTNQARLDTVSTDLEARQTSITGMIGGITDADLAQASADLEQAQLSVQAAAYVFQSFKQTSLIDFLT